MLLMACLILNIGCHDDKRAAERALAKLQRQTDVDLLQQWASSIIASEDPAERFREQGSTIPPRLLKIEAKDKPKAELIKFTNGEWLIGIDFQSGLEFYGIVLGRDDSKFPRGYDVRRLKPGVFYIFNHN
jgi:hypothetical protein